ncbi:SET and MYND domain-containing protein 3 [Phytophthora pseudosyringae]|uniref:SET and MYND domain-containing protein 3 n=1 Tax=Phytophthora pseudosyringae TaxID=221518 RepID=A0A8T1VQD2_9STRA|nr:SET and MYND domain-containing protein 3 [Phytophthora pseudosyringae]
MAYKMAIVSDCAVDASEDVSGDRGRRVETEKGLAAGDLALRASASAAVLLPELWGSHCHKCFVSGVRLRRCGRCSTAFYCSKACQQADWAPDHRKECKSLGQLAQLGLRSDQVADVLLLGRVLRRPGGEGLQPTELVWYEEDMDDQELLLLAALAQKINLVDESFSMDEMVRMLSRFRNNNFSICDELLLELGAGCFPLGAMVNHNCDPNCAVTFVPKTLDMEFRAMKPIKSGEEITQTYVDIALPRRDRQQRLQHKYHFSCGCARCSQPLQEPDSLDAFLDADVDGVPQEHWTHERQQEVEQALKEVGDVTNGVGNETDLAKQQQQCIDALQNLAERQSTSLHHGSIARLQTLSTLFSAEMERGSIEEAIGYGERMLEFYRRVYNPNHPMTGLHLFTLGDLYGQQAHSGTGAEKSKAKSSEYLAEAQRILRVTHGKDHRFVKMLADRLEKASAA